MFSPRIGDTVGVGSRSVSPRLVRPMVPRCPLCPPDDADATGPCPHCGRDPRVDPTRTEGPVDLGKRAAPDDPTRIEAVRNILDELASITPEEIQQAAQTYLQPDRAWRATVTAEAAE